MAATTSTAFACSVCLENKQEASPRVIAGTPVCAQCVQEGILPLFHEALKHEHAWPAMFGNARLNVEDFAAQLGKEFVARYRRREIEYNSREHRLYCQHMVYTIDQPLVGSSATKGTRLALNPAQIAFARERGFHLVECGGLVSGRNHRPGTRLLCYRCSGYSCSCGAELTSKDADHTCPPKEEVTAEARLIAQDQVRGRDFQLCPACNIPVTLRDGCNAITCSCLTQFCLCCGRLALHNSDHWKQGCPRWGVPGTEQAMFDHPDHLPNAGPPILPLIAFQANINQQIIAGDRPDDAFFARAAQDLANIGIQTPQDLLEEMRREA